MIKVKMDTVQLLEAFEANGRKLEEQNKKDQKMLSRLDKKISKTIKNLLKIG